MHREAEFPVGAAVTISELESDPHRVHDLLRGPEPVSWLPALGGWLVSSYGLCVEVMRDPETFTVDDPRFTTGQVVGPSMLTLETEDHARHRQPFAEAFRRSEVRARFEKAVQDRAVALVDEFADGAEADLRSSLALPLAVDVVTLALQLGDADPTEIAAIYREIVGSVEGLSRGEPPTDAGDEAMLDLGRRVAEAMQTDGSLLAHAAESLSEAEVISNAAVMMFGGIETCEAMTANALFHLLSSPSQLGAVIADRSLLVSAVEESLRLEPAATRIDRYSTREVAVGGATIGEGDLVIVSLSGANRDPDVFSSPHDFALDRPADVPHLTFAQGPHLCLGRHLARTETIAAINALLDRCPGIELDPDRAQEPHGLVFRKPPMLWATWGVLR